MLERVVLVLFFLKGNAIRFHILSYALIVSHFLRPLWGKLVKISTNKHTGKHFTCTLWQIDEPYSEEDHIVFESVSYVTCSSVLLQNTYINNAITHKTLLRLTTRVWTADTLYFSAYLKGTRAPAYIKCSNLHNRRSLSQLRPPLTTFYPHMWPWDE